MRSTEKVGLGEGLNERQHCGWDDEVFFNTPVPVLERTYGRKTDVGEVATGTRIVMESTSGIVTRV